METMILYQYSLKYDDLCKIPTTFQSNHGDLSPNYSGILIGITNSIANTMGFVAPMLIAELTKDNASARRASID